MPFQSQAQRGYMYVHHPKIAKEFEAATPKGKKLPYHVARKKNSAASINRGLGGAYGRGSKY